MNKKRKRKVKAIPIPPIIKRKVIVGIYEVTEDGKFTGYKVRCLYQNICQLGGAIKPTFLSALRLAHKHGASCSCPIERRNETTLCGVITTNL